MRFSIQVVNDNKSAICEKILRSLPKWFGIESAIINYIKDSETRPMLTVNADSEVIGFLSLTKHNTYTAEIHAMGILEKYHGKKLGRQLVEAAEKYLAEKNFKILSVKTLSENRVDENYARTRKFYLAMGFIPVEEFKSLWDEFNPCLFLIKSLPKITETTSPNMFESISLDTKHVKIRPLRSVTWEKLAEGLLYEGSFHSRNWGIKTKDDIRKMYVRVLLAPQNQIGNGFVFLNQDESEVLGMTQFMNVEPQNKMIEIGGTWINQKYQRSYVNTETKFALLQYAFEVLKLNRVEFRIDADNTTSRQAVERLKFRFDGILPRRKINANGDTRDYAFYSVTDLSWPVVKNHIKSSMLQYDSPVLPLLQNVNTLLNDKKIDEAFALLLTYLKEHANSAELNYKAACLCDRHRTEAEAVSFYLKALELGLNRAQLAGAYLGLASTYRSLGKYEQSKEFFEKGISEFPNYRPYYIFLALTEFNLSQHDKAVKLLLDQILETTNDAEILSYKRALDFYSTRLSEVFE